MSFICQCRAFFSIRYIGYVLYRVLYAKDLLCIWYTAVLLVMYIRVCIYSMHLQSIKISTDIHEKLNESKSKFIFKRISSAFKEQQLQSELIQQHYKDCKYPKIVCGDMNNSAFSYVYRNIKVDMNDAFEQAGNGFGASYNFKFYPARIDYIFVENIILVKEFKTDDSVQLSDHFPVFTRLNMQPKAKSN